MKINRTLEKDVFDWDIVNWSKALLFWNQSIDLSNKNYECLELGGNKGGLSLWLALNGNKVVCSDLRSPESTAIQVHSKYPESLERISYQAIDASQIPYKNHFDVICFKSIIGGISRDGNDKMKQKVLSEVYEALKPGGVLLFAENMTGSWLHRYFRKKFIAWGAEWNYIKPEEIDELFGSFKNVKYITVGFWGTFGRNEWQRTVLGRFDRLFEKLVPWHQRYILFGFAQK